MLYVMYTIPEGVKLLLEPQLVPLQCVSPTLHIFEL